MLNYLFHLTSFIKKINPIVFGAVIIIAWWLPYVLLYDNGTYRIHDNMDSNFVWYRILDLGGYYFKPNNFIVDEILGGVPRSGLPAEFSITTLLYWSIGPLNSYIAERLIIAFIAFFGMYKLIGFFEPNMSKWLVTLVSLSFGLLPFWPYGGLSVAGIPMLVFCYFEIGKGNSRRIYWFYLILFLLYSSLILTGIFILFYGVVHLVYNWVTRREINFRSLMVLVVIAIGYILVNYRLFLSVLNPIEGYVSHRVSFYFEKDTFLDSAGKTWKLFSQGHGHTETYQSRIILPLTLIGLTVLIWNKRMNRIHLFLFSLLLLHSIYYGFYHWSFVGDIHQVLNKVLPINFSRFFWLNGPIWYLLFALIVNAFWNRHVYINRFIVLILALNLILVVRKHEFIVNNYEPTFRSFFAQNQFENIKRDLNLKDDKVACLGIHPSIVQYNGIKTIGGYLPDYSLKYKNEFVKLLENEFRYSQELKNRFENWGSRAYLFSAQLGYNIGDYRKGNSFIINQFDIDLLTLKKLNCKYIFSAVKIDLNTCGKGLKEISKYTNHYSAWDIYVYKVII